jgi:hypothetical protein
MVVRVTWMSFTYGTIEWRRGVWTMLETHIMMSLLIFRLIFDCVLRLVSLMDITITHMVLVHEIVVLCLDALVLTHALIVVFVPRVGMVFIPRVGMVHAFPIMVHISLAQMVRYKGL